MAVSNGSSRVAKGAQDEAPKQQQGQELVITRVFDAPRDVVWEAWADREQAVQWWGPHGFTARVLEWDARPGGAWRAVMRAPDGVEYPQRGVYKEIVPQERLVFTHIWGDDPDSEMLITVTFAARGNKTEMVFRKAPFASTQGLKGEEGGWNEAFDRLQDYVTKTR